MAQKNNSMKIDSEEIEKRIYQYRDNIATHFIANLQNFHTWEYFQELAKTLQKENPNDTSFTGKIESIEEMQYFFEFRYQRKFEEWYMLGLKSDEIVEPKYIFIFDKTKTQQLITEISKNSAEFRKLTRELLFFGIAFVKEDVISYGEKQKISHENLELINELFVTGTKIIKPKVNNSGGIHYSIDSRRTGIVSNQEAEFIPVIKFLKNTVQIGKEIGKLQENMEVNLIEETITINQKTKSETFYVKYLTHFINPVEDKFKNEFKTIYDVLDKLKTLENNEENSAPKGKYKKMSIDTFYRKIDYKYSFFLHGKIYGDIKTGMNGNFSVQKRGMHFDGGHVSSPILTCLYESIKSRMNALSNELRNSLSFEFGKNEITFDLFKSRIKENLDQYIEEQKADLYNKICGLTDTDLLAIEIDTFGQKTCRFLMEENGCRIF